MLVNDIMTYQYPSPGTPPPPYNTGYTVAPHMTGMTMRSPDQPGRSGSPAISFELKRANSQSNIKLDPESEESNMAAAGEKKRNKLGYHRASAACSENYSPNDTSLSLSLPLTLSLPRKEKSGPA